MARPRPIKTKRKTAAPANSTKYSRRGERPVLSVITIVYNNVRDIERTMLSVLRQTYPLIEYIIIDGGSTDGTMDVVNKYRDKLTDVVSERDEGIYDAMNKGLRLAKGDYILFMNSGDEIYATYTVKNVFASSPWADVYYGETEMYDSEWNNLGPRRHAAPARLTHAGFRHGMSVSHQAIYVMRSLAHDFDRRYSYSADIDWVLNVLKKASTIVNTNMFVAKYLVGGTSKTMHYKSLTERFSIFTRHYGLIPNLFNHVVIAWKLVRYYLAHGRTND